MILKVLLIPRWDADYHDYANGLDVLVDAKTTGDTDDGGVASVNTAGDRNEWGRIDKRYTRHSLTGIPGANGKARFSHKPCCGMVGHGGKYYLPLRLASLELEMDNCIGWHTACCSSPRVRHRCSN